MRRVLGWNEATLQIVQTIQIMPTSILYNLILVIDRWCLTCATSADEKYGMLCVPHKSDDSLQDYPVFCQARIVTRARQNAVCETAMYQIFLLQRSQSETT